MSATSSAGSPPRARGGESYETVHGHGWIGFAGAMLAILGTLNVIYGIGAIDDARVFVGDTQYIFGDLNTWGWFLVVVGAVQVVAAFGIWSGSEWGRWVGVFFAGGNAILNMLFIPAFPFLSLALFAVDILVIYGLIAYGGRRETA